MTTRSAKSVRRRAVLRRCPVFFAVAALFAPPAQANPTGASVVAGSATFQGGPGTLTVTNAPGTVIDWKSFSIGQGELTRFVQQSASSEVLNRVTGGDPSQILGSLQSNGRVFLINQNGIAFGANARVDVAGLVASTLSLSNADFLAGRLVLSPQAGAGGIVNQGTIKTASGGQVVLVAPTVENHGVIEAPNGDVVLAAGRSANLVDLARPEIQVEVSAPSNEVLNVGRLVGRNISIYAGAIRHSGTASANTAVLGENGKIVFKAVGSLTAEAGSRIEANGAEGGSIALHSGDTTLVSGAVEATGSAGKGGTIDIRGDKVGLFGSAAIDASGTTGGGTVLVGGDYQGKGTGQNASVTYVGKDATIIADARVAGNGGKVILWADGITRFYGTISARGGAGAGNGGFVETSGKIGLDIHGARVDTSAPFGITGFWLLDPTNINVVGADPGDGSYSSDLTAVDAFADGDVGTGLTSIDVASINGASANVTLQASNDITFNTSVNIAASGVGLSVEAGNSIVSTGYTIATNNGAVSLTANTMSLGDINTGGGSIAINNSGVASLAGSYTTAGGAFSVGGNVTLAGVTTIGTGAGNIDLVGAVGGAHALTLNSSGATTLGADAAVASLTTDAGGSTSVKSVTTSGAQTYGDNVTLNGSYQTTASGFSIGGTTTLAGATTVTTGTGDIGFTGAVDGAQTLTLNSSGATSFGAAVGSGTALTSLTTNAGGSTSLKSVTTTGAQTFGDNVTLNGTYQTTDSSFSVGGTTTLAGATTVTTGTGDIGFTGAVDGAQTLTLNSSGATSFAAAVGSTNALTSLTTNAGGSTSVKSVTTSGAQNFGDAVVLAADTTLTGAGITFNGTVDGGRNLTLADSGTTTFNGLVGNTTALTSLTTNAGGGTTINTSGIRTSGAQIYNDAVNLSADTTLTGAGITFNGTVDGARGLTIADSGTTAFNGLVGGGTALTSLTTNAGGNTTINTGGIRTSGAQIYNDTVNLAADTTLTGVGLNFGNTLSGAGRNLTLASAAGDITLGGSVGSGASPLGTVLITDARDVNIGAAVNAATVRQTTGTGTTTINAPITTTAGGNGIDISNNALVLNSALVSTGRDILLGADASISLAAGSIDAGAATVTIGNNVAGADLSVGAGPGLVVAAADLDKVSSASAIRLGNAKTRDIAIGAALAPEHVSSLSLVAGGNISIDAVLAPAHALSLVAGGDITQTAAVNAGNLRVTAGGNVTLTTVANNVTTFAATMSGGGDKTLALKTTGALNIGTVDGVVGINTTPGGGAASAASAAVTLQSTGGAITQTERIVAGTLDVTAPTAITLAHAANDIVNLKADSGAGLTFYDFNGYRVSVARFNGLDFSSGGSIDFQASLNDGKPLNIDAGTGNLRIDVSGGTGDIKISGPGQLKGANITLKTSATNDIIFTGGATPGQSNDITVTATNKLTISTRNLTVSGGMSTAGPNQTLKNDAILEAAEMDIKTTEDFIVKGGKAIAVSGAGGDSASQASAFVKTPLLKLDVGRDLILQGGTVSADSSAGGSTTTDATAIFLVSGAKDIKVGGDMVVVGGKSESFAGSNNKANAFAVFDPETPMTITTGGSIVLIGGTALAPVLSSASIQNAGTITFNIGGSGVYTDTIRGTGDHNAGLLIMGGAGSGLFNVNSDPVTVNEYPIKYTFTNGGSYTVLTHLAGGDAFVKSRAPVGIDESLLGYINFAANTETLTKGKRTQTDQATGERIKTGQCR